MGNGRWLLLLCGGRIAFSLMVMAYPAVMPVVMPLWDMSSAQAGLVQSGWHIGYLISLVIAGLLTDRFGARQTYLWMSIVACASGSLFAFFASSFHSALVLYFLAGVASGGAYTPGLVLIGQRFPAAERGTAMGWYLAAASLGYALVLFASGVLAPWMGWRSTLFLSAAATYCGGVMA